MVLGGAFAACGSDTSEFTRAPEDDSGVPSNGDATTGVADGTFVIDPNDGAVSPVATLAFDPPNQTLTVDGITPQAASFTLKATLKDGTVTTVTPQSMQFDRPDLAKAVNGTPVTVTAAGAYAGTGRLHGIYGGVEAVADLTVKVVRKIVGAGVTPAIQAALDGATTADPSLTTMRYPYDKTVFPLGLVSPLVMWNAPAAGDVYRLHVEQANYTFDAYATVSAKGQLRIDQTVWDRMTASNGGDAFKVALSRYSVSTQTAYTSASQEWKIAPASLRGAIYYWTASKLNGVSQGHIARIRPGTGALPEAISTGQSDQCMGCHAVSADGSTLAASVENAPTGEPNVSAYTNGWKNGRAWASFDLPSGTVRKQTTYFGGNLALTPDGAYTVFGGRAQTNAQASSNQWQPGSKYMTLADTKTGTIVVNSGLDAVQLADATMGLSMPAFSPDGKALAAIEFKVGSAGDIRDNVLPDSRAIVLFAFNRQTLTFAPTPTRLPVGTYTPYTMSGMGYPSFTPDGKYVAFHVGNHSTGCYGACDDTVQHRGALWFQGTDGTGQPVRMSALDDPPATIDREMSVEPTFNPIERGGYAWVVLTSSRDWGNQLTGTANNGKRRLWVAAIDPTSSSGVDPSHPPFYLEGQEDSPNMRGFWTLASCTPTTQPGGGGGTCAAGFECCSGFCDTGVCVDVSSVACSGLGGACKTVADCCNPSSVSCIDGVCTTVIPK